MRPCQRKHYEHKKQSYRDSINKARITIEEQQKRIKCFQGLIAQLTLAMKETDDDVKL